jgi:hypothetical protein
MLDVGHVQRVGGCRRWAWWLLWQHDAQEVAGHGRSHKDQDPQVKHLSFKVGSRREGVLLAPALGEDSVACYKGVWLCLYTLT